MKGRIIVIAALGIMLGALGSSAGAAAKPKTHTITMQGMHFEPESVTVTRGDVIVWVNKDIVDHTATSNGVFESKAIGPEKSWKYTVKAKGDYAYACRFHPTMKGTLHVK